MLDAVETSKAVGAPVKVIWSREDDMKHDYYRPVTYVRMWGRSMRGQPRRLEAAHRSVVAAEAAQPGALDGIEGVDAISVEGAANLPYAIPESAGRVHRDRSGHPVWLLAIGGQLGQRLRDRGVHRRDGDGRWQRSVSVPARAARVQAAPPRRARSGRGEGGWTKPLASGRFRGIAVHECFGSIIGLVTEISVEKNAVRVHKMTCAVDCGWIVNPDTIKAQMEGGIVYGLTRGAQGRDHHPQRARRAEPLRRLSRSSDMPEMPVIDVHIVPSTEAPGGIGEPSTAVIAGSLANAVFAATGKRIYSLPITLA